MPHADLIWRTVEMPAKYLMTWEQKDRRWAKQYNGRREKISCSQLAKWAREFVPETKEGSYQFANRWWTARKAAIDGQRPPHPFADYLDLMRRRVAWLERHGDSELASMLGAEIAEVKKGSLPSFLDPSIPDEVLDAAPEWGSMYSNPHEPARDSEEHLLRRLRDEELGQAFDPFDKVWEGRLHDENRDRAAPEATIGRRVDQWLSLQRDLVHDDLMSPGSYDNKVDQIHWFREWIGPQYDVSVINAELWEQFYKKVLKYDKWTSSETRKKYFATARQFIDWLASKDLIPVPRNLHSRHYRFKGSTTAKGTMTVSVVREIIGRARGQLQLHLLLMANCGMLQKDVSDLRQEEVDWEDGRIIRQRSKARRQAGAPVVNYKLWDTTFRLLKEHRSRGNDFVLLTEKGKRWVYEVLDPETQKKKSTDTIATLYNYLFGNMKEDGKIIKSLKYFRKTSASILHGHNSYSRYVQHFLGHVGRTVADRNYVTPSQKQFDKAIRWLGLQYGFSTV
jgi:integrase